MTKKVKRAYASLSFKAKLGIALTMSLILLASVVLVAVAGTGISFSNQIPGAGTVTGSAQPAVSVRAVAAEGTIAPGDVVMTINGGGVTPSVSFASGAYTISHTPAGKLQDGVQTVAVGVYDTAKGLYESTSWNFTVDAAPKASSWAPARGSLISNRNPVVSVNVRDTYNPLNAGSVRAKLNGSSVTPSFLFKGRWIEDSCGGNPYYQIDSYQEGTISFNASNLADGVQTVEVSIADTLGNVLTETWSFTVAMPPTFNSLVPASGSKVGGTATISAVVSSATGVDWGTVALKVNGGSVTHTADPATGTVSFAGPIPDGNVTVYIEARDTDGYLGTHTWSFNKNSALPVASSWVPTKNSTVKVSDPKVSVNMTSGTPEDLNPASVSASLNGLPVNVEFQYKGYWYTDACTGNKIYFITSRREGTISFNTSGLTDGVQNVQVSIADTRGNVKNESWSFTVAVPPSFTDFTPADNSKQRSVGTVSVKVVDQSVNWSSLVFRLNTTTVIPVVDQNTNTVSFTGKIPEGNVTAYITVRDTAGNIGSTNWKFANDNTAPVASIFQCPTNITNGMLTFSGQLNDAVNIKRGVVASLIGTELKTGQPVDRNLSVTFRFRGYTDECTGNYIENQFFEAYFNYSEAIRDGDYTLRLSWEDELGNSRTHTVNLTVRTPPVFANHSPTQYGLQTRTPEIGVTVRDINGTVENLVVTHNGEPVNYTYNTTTHRLTFVPALPLDDESYHTITVTATDDQGLTAARTWTFLTNEKGYSDMADSSYQSCTACHDISGGTNPLENQTVHRGLPFSGGHAAKCDLCHNYITYPAACGQCHFGDDECNDGSAYHGYSLNLSYSAKNYNTFFPIRVLTNRELFDCIVCHQPGAGTTMRISWGSNSRRPMRNHDIPQLHLTENTPEFCGDCHAKSLTREHARLGRGDENGNPITCNTCHLSSKASVRDAIRAKDSSCEACHPNSDHDSFHVGTMESNCATCHVGVLTTEHMANPKTTGGKDYNCKTCHMSTKREVRRTIASKRLNCTGCHVKGHDIYFADTVPDEVPLYEGFNWTTPLDTAIFFGEDNIPPGYDMGQVLLSNRRANVNADQIWQFYRDRLTSMGWTVKSGTPSAGATNFAAEFVKGKKGIFIYCFRTANRNGSGAEVPAGYRVEVWYK